MAAPNCPFRCGTDPCQRYRRHLGSRIADCVNEDRPVSGNKVFSIWSWHAGSRSGGTGSIGGDVAHSARFGRARCRPRHFRGSKRRENTTALGMAADTPRSRERDTLRSLTEGLRPSRRGVNGTNHRRLLVRISAVPECQSAESINTVPLLNLQESIRRECARLGNVSEGRISIHCQLSGGVSLFNSC
jgi:hypothetical protein